MKRQIRPVSQVRIIGGVWKRTPLPVANVPGLRPTPDRVRETVFNWLGQDLTGLRCLDLFAGTGAMSFEAASRGAECVLGVEQSAPAYRLLQAMQEKLKATQIHLLRADAEKIARDLQARGEQFDIIFLDPPFHQGWAEKILPLAACLLAPSGRLYWEADTALTDDQAQHYGLQLQRLGQAGQVHYHVLQKASPDFLNKEQIS